MLYTAQRLLRVFFRSQLGIKLIFSHLLVALGSLLILMIVVLLAVQNYFANSQKELIYAQSLYIAQHYEDFYRDIGNSWDNIPPTVQQGDDLSLLIITDQFAHAKLLRVPRYLTLSSSEASLIQQSITQALSGRTVTGYLQDGTPHAFSGYYTCLPLTMHGQMIGAMFFARPEIYPQGFSPDSFLTNVSTAILFSGAGIAVIVALSSLFFVYKLTRPLVRMKQVVDKLSTGDYAERISGPFENDELGQLVQSFNTMATRIEDDIYALQQQEQYRQEMTANIAHDLSTPLSSIRGFSEALADGIIQDEQDRAEVYKVIIRECERLTHLVKDVQQLSSLESGQISLDYSLVDLSTLVKETIEVIAHQCQEAHIAVQNNVEQMHNLMIYADSDRIIQVLLNLLDNARHHTPRGGTITIESVVENERVILWIKDTGNGIAPENLPYIFDRFYRADSARTYATGGSGLGLAIVKTIITLHGGTIHAESLPGEGTTMIMTLRAAAL